MRLILLALLFSSNIVAQSYFNIVLPEKELINPNPVILVEYSDGYAIASLNFINGVGSSSIYLIDEFGEFVDTYDYPNYSLTRKSLLYVNDTFYGFGDYNIGDERLFQISLDNNFNIGDSTFYNTSSMNNGSTACAYLNDHIYGASVDDFSNGDVREITLLKNNLNGENIWTYNLNNGLERSLAYELLASQDSNLLISSMVNYFQTNGAFSQVMKLDQSGSIIWKNEGSEMLLSGATQTLLAELGNGQIVQAYEINRFSDLEFITKGWDRFPTRLKFISSIGDSIGESILTFPQEDDLIITQIESKNTDYFFACGRYRVNSDPAYGLITKYDSQGDTIWTHRYQHPDYIGLRNHIITEIIELDNGDIVATGNITKPGERTIVWVFKVNEYGCLKDGLEDCDEIVTSNHNINEIPVSVGWVMSPNPSSGSYTIISDELSQLQGIEVFNAALVKIKSTKGQVEVIDLSDVPLGIYYIKLYLRNGKYVVKRVIKL